MAFHHNNKTKAQLLWSQLSSGIFLRKV